MIKVSFIAIVLAAIGYKEYNPSVEGKWELKSDKRYKIEYFENGTFASNAILGLKDFPLQKQLEGTYSFFNDTIAYQYSKDSIIHKVILLRQSRNKMYLKSTDSDNRKKTVLKRIK